MTVTEKVAQTAKTVAESAKRGVATPVKRSVVGFWRGLTYPFRGARVVYLRKPGLIRYWGIPILVTIVAVCGIFWGAFSVRDAIVEAVWTAPTTAGFWPSVARFFHTLLEWLVGLTVALAGLVALSLVTNVIAAPFNDALSEAVERLETGAEGVPFSVSVLVRDLIRTVRLEVTKLALYVAVMGPLFLAAMFVPVVGQILYSVFGFVFTAIYFSIDYIDWPASRHDRGLRYRFSVLRRNFWPMFGFGTGVWLFLFVPFVNLLFMPAAVAGGTLLFLELERHVEPAPPSPAP
jgi:CysZ protein